MLAHVITAAVGSRSAEFKSFVMSTLLLLAHVMTTAALRACRLACVMPSSASSFHTSSSWNDPHVLQRSRIVKALSPGSGVSLGELSAGSKLNSPLRSSCNDP